MTVMADIEATPINMALSDLVRTRRAELRLSLRALAERCVVPETGERPIKYSWLSRLENGNRVIPPQTPELCALASGLMLPLRHLQDAAGQQFMGISPVVISPSGDMEALIHQAERLDQSDLARLRAIAESLGSVSRDTGK